MILSKMQDAIAQTNDNNIKSHANNFRWSLSHAEYLTINPRMDFDDPWGDGQLRRPHSCMVVHVHGRYYDVGLEHGFSLTSTEYSNPVVMQKFLDFMVPLASQRSLIFVGAAGTIYDAHFLNLWEELGRAGRDNRTNLDHHILCSDREFGKISGIAGTINSLFKTKLRVHNFYKVGINGDHTQLFKNLEKANRKGQSKRYITTISCGECSKKLVHFSKSLTKLLR